MEEEIEYIDTTDYSNPITRAAVQDLIDAVDTLILDSLGGI